MTFGNKSLCISNPDGVRKSNFHVWRNETRNISDYQYAIIFRFVMLDIKLWLTDDNILYQV